MRIYSLILGFLLFITCSHNTVPEMSTAEEEYIRAYRYFEEEDYGKCIELFRYFFNRYPGSELVDDAQFYYSESYFMVGNYMEALQEFQFLVNNFPNSEYSEKSLLRVAQCYENMSPIVQREQKLTKQALDIYEEFIVRYPYSKLLEEAKVGRDRMMEKLNRKLLETAEIYIKMGRDEAAEIYLKTVVKRSNKWNNNAYMLLGDIALSNGNDSLAVFYYGKISGKLEEEAKERLNSIR